MLLPVKENIYHLVIILSIVLILYFVCMGVKMKIKSVSQRKQIKERWKNSFDKVFNGNDMKIGAIWVTQWRIETVDSFEELG